VRADQKIQAHVPLIDIGTPEGVRNKGGVLDHLVRELHVECLPENLPSEIQVDITHLDLEQALHVSDIALPEGVVALNPADVTVFMVHPPRVIETPQDEEEASTEVPEIGKESEAEEKEEPAKE
jgi:large subunit ribosomal protein L25